MSHYRLTRQQDSSEVTFEEAVLTGLAPDGGLYLPSSIPKAPEDFLTKWKNLSFPELAFEILRLYIHKEEIGDDELKELVTRSYSTFRHKDVTPLHKLEQGLNVLELFHGPTYAFKDVALQFVGNLFEFFLQRKNKGLAPGERHEITVVGATSGDTGSAAIYGLRNKKDVSVFILYPTGRISEIQEQQMTTVEDANVHTLSVAGYFDDCQNIVKEIFADKQFNEKYHVGAINLINWARILAQITYYFYLYLRLEDQETPVKYVVPSGNFGDILAGYYAKKMGLPIAELVIATNENDILDRFMKSGRYEKEGAQVSATHSPAMDILILSNFERLLWYLVRDDVSSDSEAGKILSQYMLSVKAGEPVQVSPSVLEAARKDFDSARVSNDETIATIKEVYSKYSKYIVDPHTAVGICATEKVRQPGFQYVTLSTAHPAKFADAVNKALSSFDNYSFEKDALPEELRILSTKEKRIILVKDVTKEAVQEIIIRELKK